MEVKSGDGNKSVESIETGARPLPTSCIEKELEMECVQGDREASEKKWQLQTKAIKNCVNEPLLIHPEAL